MKFTKYGSYLLAMLGVTPSSLGTIFRQNTSHYFCSAHVLFEDVIKKNLL